MTRFLSIIILVALSVGRPANAESVWQDYTRLSLTASHIGLTDGDEFWVLAHISLLKPKWYTYWFNPGDSGAQPKFSWQSNIPLTIEGPFYPTPTRHESSGLVAFSYEREVKFPFRIRLQNRPVETSVLILRLNAEWLVCDDVCIPATIEQELRIRVDGRTQLSGLSKEIDEVLAQLPEVKKPTSLRWVSPNQLNIEGLTALQIKNAKDFFPNPSMDVPLSKPTLRESRDRLGIQFAVPKKVPRKEDVGGLLIFNEQFDAKPIWFGFTPLKQEVTATLTTPRLAEISSQGIGILMAILGAFVGGLLLNLMPCVFPILSLKVFSVLKSLGHKDATARLKKDTLAYSAGIMISFLGLGLLLVGLQNFGLQLGWGFQLQNPAFLVFLVLLFHALALNMAGVFELQFSTPQLGASGYQKQTSLVGAFMTGVLAVIVASPCSAPFMGAAIGYALAQSTVTVISVFLALGLGLAFPYLLVAFVPFIAHQIPKPGPWMNTFKMVMTYPLYLTALWLLWVLGQVTDNNFVIYTLVLVLFLTPVLLLKDLKVQLMSLVLYLALVIGSFAWAEQALVNSNHATESTTDHLAKELAALSEQKSQPVFVNFTADWCLSCKVNERLIFKTPQFQELLAKYNVRYKVVDWTRREDAIAKYLKRFDRAGVPLYLLFPAQAGEPKILPELLTMTTISTEFSLLAVTRPL